MTEFKFPNEIKDLVNSLGHENKWKILELLINNNNENGLLSYSEILRGLKLDEKNEHGKLNRHLKDLQLGGWLTNISKAGTAGISDRRSSFYKLSKFSMKATEGMLKAMDRKQYTDTHFGSPSSLSSSHSRLKIRHRQ